MENELQLQKTQQLQRGLELHSQTQSSKGVSVFAGMAAATDEYIQQWAATMAAAFPQMQPPFWAICCKMIKRDGLSKARLQYIANTLVREWRYPTLQIADILQVDKKVKIWSYAEFYRHFGSTEASGYCIIKERDNSGRIQFCATADAERCGIEIQIKF